MKKGSVQSTQILVLGSTGQLGSTLFAEHARQQSESAGDVHLVAKTRDALDISDFEETRRQLELLQPDCVINAAGISDWRAASVDRQESWATIVHGADNLVKICAFLGIPLIQMSCHSVFGMSRRGGPFCETDSIAPPNFHAQALAAAEHAVLRLGQCASNDMWDAGFRYWVIRSGPLFSAPGGRVWTTDLTRSSFVSPRSASHPDLLAAHDVRISPTYTPHLARVLLWLATHVNRVPCGVLHAANKGAVTPFEFATHLARHIDWRGSVIQPTTIASLAKVYGDRADEICHSTPLNCEKLSYQTPLELPSWTEAVAEFATSMLGAA